MTPTLAKSKAARLASPASLSMTPNARVVMAAALSSLALQRESTSIVSLVNPAATLNIDVDAQNFSAMGGQFFIVKADTTDASTITVNYVHGNTTHASQVFAVAADSIGQLVLGAVVSASNDVDLVVIGHHVVGKPNATGGETAISGVVLHHLSYANHLLHYTGGAMVSAAASIELLPFQAIDLTLPMGAFECYVVLSACADLADDTQQLASLTLLADLTGQYTGSMIGNDNAAQSLSANHGAVLNLQNYGNSQMGVGLAGVVLYSKVNPSLANASKVYLHLVFSSADADTLPDLPMVILPQPIQV